MGQVLCCCEREYNAVNGELTETDTCFKESLTLSLKVLLLGDSGVGKSSFFKRYIKNEFVSQHCPTMAPDFVSKNVTIRNSSNDGVIEAAIQFWDTAGHQRYRNLGQIFYNGSDIILFIYDVTSQQSLENVELWIKKFEQIRRKHKNKKNNKNEYRVVTPNGEIDENDNKTQEDSNNNYIGYIVGNKMDCVDASAIEGENETISKLLEKYKFIKGHSTISCKNMQLNDSADTIETLVKLYVSSVTLKTDITDIVDMGSSSSTQNTSTSDNGGGEQTPLLEKYKR